MCKDCNNWSRKCTSENPAAQAWAVKAGAAEGVAPDTYPPGRCPGLSPVRRSSSRTLTPCYTEKL